MGSRSIGSHPAIRRNDGRLSTPSRLSDLPRLVQAHSPAGRAQWTSRLRQFLCPRDHAVVGLAGLAGLLGPSRCRRNHRRDIDSPLAAPGSRLGRARSRPKVMGLPIREPAHRRHPRAPKVRRSLDRRLVRGVVLCGGLSRTATGSIHRANLPNTGRWKVRRGRGRLRLRGDRIRPVDTMRRDRRVGVLPSGAGCVMTKPSRAVKGGYRGGSGGTPPKRPTSAGASVNPKGGGQAAKTIRSARRTARSA